MNNQFYGILPIEKGVFDYFPGNKNERINIMFGNPDGSTINIIVPIDTLLFYAKKMG